MASHPTNTVIVGAGIIGLSTAFYLSESGRTPAQSIHLVDLAPRLFSSASGNAGGFLAKDWFGPATAALGRLSFELHKDLSERYNGSEKWGYTTTTGASYVDRTTGEGARGEDWLIEGGSRASVAGEHTAEEGNGPKWLAKRKGVSIETISEDESTAQVNPLRLCSFLLDECKNRGVQVHHPAQVISVSKDIRGEIAAVRIAKDDGQEVEAPCSRLVITAGAWTSKVFKSLFPNFSAKIHITSLAGHHIVVKTPGWTGADDAGHYAVFATDSSGFSPEIFSRSGGEIYVAGLNDASLPLPDLATDSKPDSSAIELLKTTIRRLFGDSDQPLEVLREGLCFRPVTPSSGPVISRVPDEGLGADFRTRPGADGGVFVAAGHGPWGISQSLGTGKILCELIENRKLSADIKSLLL